MNAAGALVGATGAVGLISAVRSSPPMRRPRLADRMAPYLRPGAGAMRGGRGSGATPLGVVERLVGPVVRDAARRLDSLLGGSEGIRRRLVRAGRAGDVELFRATQLARGAAGLALGVLLGVLALARGSSPVTLVGAAALGALAGVVSADRALTRDVQRRERRIITEFPAVADMLALAVAAGESPAGALARVASLCRGALAEELAEVVAQVRAGDPLPAALDELAGRTSVPALARFADAVSVAVERGTPLADVLRAQAADAREAGKRALLEAGGRKEIAMLVPVVFLVLPVTVLFAVFPGFYGLNLSVP